MSASPNQKFPNRSGLCPSKVEVSIGDDSQGNVRSNSGQIRQTNRFPRESIDPIRFDEFAATMPRYARGLDQRLTYAIPRKDFEEMSDFRIDEGESARMTQDMPTAETDDRATRERTRLSAAEELERLIPRLTDLSIASRVGVTAPQKGAWKAVYLASIAQCANVTIACRVAKITRTSTQWARENDPEFAQAEKEAMEAGVDLVEASAFKSAVYGDLRPVYQQGMKVGEVLEYSDAMRALLLKGRRREVFGDKIDVSATVLNVHLTLDDMRAKIAESLQCSEMKQVADAEPIADENEV